MAPDGLSSIIVATSVVLTGADPPSNAEMLCYTIDNTRSIAPCTISEARHIVTINIKLKGKDAGDVCRQVQASLVKQRMFFDDARWRLEITTPATGGTVVASCDLPQTLK